MRCPAPARSATTCSARDTSTTRTACRSANRTWTAPAHLLKQAGAEELRVTLDTSAVAAGFTEAAGIFRDQAAKAGVHGRRWRWAARTATGGHPRLRHPVLLPLRRHAHRVPHLPAAAHRLHHQRHQVAGTRTSTPSTSRPSPPGQEGPGRRLRADAAPAVRRGRLPGLGLRRLDPGHRPQRRAASRTRPPPTPSTGPASTRCGSREPACGPGCVRRLLLGAGADRRRRPARLRPHRGAAGRRRGGARRRPARPRADRRHPGGHAPGPARLRTPGGAGRPDCCTGTSAAR